MAMKIKAESSYDDFSANVSFIQSTVRSAIENRDLVDEEFDTVKKYSVKWIILTIIRPFFAFFGHDTYSHVRVDAVARAVLTYCDLNKKYLTLPLQKEIYNGILEPLHNKTHKKYAATISEIAEGIVQKNAEGAAYWNNQLTRLQSLKSASWDSGIPDLPRFPRNWSELDKLCWILAKLQKIADHPQLIQVAPDTFDTLYEKIWKYASEIQDGARAIEACKTCFDYLSDKGGDALNAIYTEPTTFVFSNGKEVKLAGFYKKILATQSPYFNRMFEGTFKEAQDEVVHLPKANEEHFSHMLQALETRSLTLNDYDFEKLLEFTAQADEHTMTRNYNQATQLIAETIKKFEQTTEYLEVVEAVKTLPYLEGDQTIQQAVKDYFQKYLDSGTTFTETLDFLKKHGAPLSHGLTLKNCTGDELRQLLSLYPNLLSLNLNGCSALHDDDLRSLEFCTSLGSLDLRGWKNLTKKGLYHLQHLQHLKMLDLRDCTSIWRNELEVLREQINNGLKINSHGCATDVEEERQQRQRAEKAREAQAMIMPITPFCLTCGHHGWCVHNVLRYGKRHPRH
jgi:BTB/POZ domain-containing protein